MWTDIFGLCGEQVLRVSRLTSSREQSEGATGTITKNAGGEEEGRGRQVWLFPGSAWGGALPREGSEPSDQFLEFSKLLFLPNKTISELKHKINYLKHKTQCNDR